MANPFPVEYENRDPDANKGCLIAVHLAQKDAAFLSLYALHSRTTKSALLRKAIKSGLRPITREELIEHLAESAYQEWAIRVRENGWKRGWSTPSARELRKREYTKEIITALKKRGVVKEDVDQILHKMEDR